MEFKNQCQACSINSTCHFFNNNLIKEEEGFVMVRMHYYNGQMIFKQGSYASGIFVVVNGVVKKTYTEFNHDEVIFEIAGNTEILGFHPYLDFNTHFEYTAQSLTDVEVCMIPSNVVVKYLLQELSFKELLMRLSKRQVKMSMRFMLMFRNKSVKQRIALILLYWQDKANMFSNELVPMLSREDFATLSYTTSESITRFFSELKRSKIIETKGSTIKILDREYIKKIAKCHSDRHLLYN